jgi:hypothetical protein
VVTILDVDGYPVSVRETTRRYNAATGELLIGMPQTLRAAEGPANLLCHYHDEKLWNLRAIQIKGLLEQRWGDWVFVSTAFAPPASGQLRSLWRLAKQLRTSANNYLRRRGLERPQVNWVAIKTLQRRARESARG